MRDNMLLVMLSKSILPIENNLDLKESIECKMSPVTRDGREPKALHEGRRSEPTRVT